MSVLETALRGFLKELVREALREELGAASNGGSEGFIKLGAAAKFAGDVSVSTIEKWGRQGLAIHKRGHVRVVEVDELRAFLRRKETTKTSEPETRAKEILASVTQMRRVR